MTMYIQHKPGEKLFVDWAGNTMKVVNRLTGEKIKVYLFVYALGISGYPYAETFFNMGIANGGACAHLRILRSAQRILVPDNLRTGLEKAHNYDPVENRSYREMAEHYSTAIVPERICRPWNKSEAENSMGDIEMWIMAAPRKRTFISLSELNAAGLERLKAFSVKSFPWRCGGCENVFLEEDKL